MMTAATKSMEAITRRLMAMRTTGQGPLPGMPDVDPAPSPLTNGKHQRGGWPARSANINADSVSDEEITKGKPCYIPRHITQGPESP